MSLTMNIDAALNERSAEEAADHAVRVFADAGQRASQAFNENVDRGVKDTRFADSTGMKEKFDAWVGSSATAGGDAGKQASEKFGAEVVRDADQHGRVVASRFLEGLTSQLSGGIPGVGGMLSGLTRTATEMGSGISAAGLVAAAGVASIGAAAVAAGVELYQVGERFDNIADSIAVRTGKTGDDLNSLTDSVNRVGQTTASSLEDIADITGRVAQSFDVSGAPLEKLTAQIADLDRMTGEKLNVRQFAQTMRGFGQDAGDAGTGLDQLYDASTRTGIPVNELVSDLQGLGPAARALGLDINQTAGLIASFNDAGIDATSTVSGLNHAAQTFAQNNIPLQTGLQDTITQLKGFIDAGDEASAVDLAGKVFGTDNAQKFVDLIQQGKLDVDTLREGLSSTGTTIEGMKDKTSDLHEEWQKVKNRVSEIAEILGGPFFQGMNELMSGSFAQMAVPPSLIDEIKQRQLDQQRSGPGGPSSPTGSREPGWGAPDGHTPYDIAGILDKDKKNPLDGLTKKGRGGSQTPSIPLDQYSLDKIPLGSFEGETPPGQIGPSPFAPGTGPAYEAGQFVVDPQKKYAAESREIAARDAVEQARARLLELQAKGDATEQQLQSAKNSIIQNNRSLVTAEQELADAQQGTWKKLSDSVKQAHSDMQELGAAVDKDFGISKGLPGIADNLVRFMASLAAAPALGQLNAKSTGDAGGYGLIGSMAAQGAFGPQYTGTGSYGAWTPTGSGQQKLPPGVYPSGTPGGAYPGGPAATPQPGESARDFAHRAMEPHWESEGFQVGDHAADKYGEHQHGALDIMIPNLGAGNKVLQEALQDPNVYGAIFNNQTYGYGHGATPQDYSAGHTGDPNQDHQNHVHIWYKPGGDNNIAPAGSSASAHGANWDATAQGESGGNWSTNTGNGYSGGLQFTPSSWQAAGGSQYAPQAWQATPEQQKTTADQLLRMQGPGAWPNTFVPNAPGGPIAAANAGGPPMTYSGTGIGFPMDTPAGGAGSPMQPPGPFGHAGAGAGPTQIGGVTPPSGTGQGGVGMEEGGLLDTAIGAAASGLDLMAPGAGQAAQTGIKLANRAIKYAGQVAGIGVQGLMETFLPTGASELANKNWFTRIVGGLAGAAPALPNTAGKNPGQPQPQGQPDVGQGAQGVTNNLTVNNNNATEDMVGKDFEHHLNRMYGG